MPEKLLYFAYGSNMSTKRLLSRVPSGKCIGRAKLLDKDLVCNKEGEDGSGKANLVDSPGDVVWGVLYEIDPREINKLDRVEDGYQRVTLEVITDQGNSLKAQVYFSLQLTDDPRPYTCYKDLIVKGAIKHQLPKYYVSSLEQIPSKDK
jgi:gamma-glutamylcyclotransferase